MNIRALVETANETIATGKGQQAIDKLSSLVHGCAA